MKIALIDADSPVYAAGFAVQKNKYIAPDGTAFDRKRDAVEAGHSELRHEQYVEPVENALHIINTMLIKMLDAVKADRHEIYLSGTSNFRKDIATIIGYKANRVQPKPVHYDAIRQHLVDRWNAIVIDGQEADDELGIRATEIQQAGDDSIIVSIDKDLLTIPSKHYNWKKEVWHDIDDETGMRNFYVQCLSGDRSDNIPGIDGVGIIKGALILEKCVDPEEMEEAVREAWRSYYPKGYVAEDGTLMDTDKVVDEIKKLLWIRRGRHEALA